MDHRKKILDLHYFENSGTKTLTEVDLKRIVIKEYLKL